MVFLLCSPLFLAILSPLAGGRNSCGLTYVVLCFLGANWAAETRILSKNGVKSHICYEVIHVCSLQTDEWIHHFLSVSAATEATVSVFALQL